MMIRLLSCPEYGPYYRYPPIRHLMKAILNRAWLPIESSPFSILSGTQCLRIIDTMLLEEK